MSKAEILDELPKLLPDERRQIFEKLCELQNPDLVDGVARTAEEKALLDHELEDYEGDPEAGSSWEAVEPRLLNPALK
jgi:putative addiction module component (TIGR02574 family)